MLGVVFTKIRQDKLDDLAQWMAELESRQEEVRASFEREGMRHEKAYLLSTSDGPILIYAMEADDVEAAQSRYVSSPLPIDAEHQRVLLEVSEATITPELLFEARRTEPGDGPSAPRPPGRGPKAPR